MFKRIIGIVSLLLLILFISCSDNSTSSTNPNGNGNDTATVSPIGSWTTTLPISDAIPYETSVLMTFANDADTSFTIVVKQIIPIAGPDPIPVYQSDGTSSKIDEAIIVISENCVKYNFTTKEYEAVDPEICGEALPIPTAGLNENTWAIPGTMALMLPFLPELTDDQKAQIASLTIVFNKVTE